MRCAKFLRSSTLDLAYLRCRSPYRAAAIASEPNNCNSSAVAASCLSKSRERFPLTKGGPNTRRCVASDLLRRYSATWGLPLSTSTSARATNVLDTWTSRASRDRLCLGLKNFARCSSVMRNSLSDGPSRALLFSLLKTRFCLASSRLNVTAASPNSFRRHLYFANSSSGGSGGRASSPANSLSSSTIRRNRSKFSRHASTSIPKCSWPRASSQGSARPSGALYFD
mmetsp:Transcript_11752/g.34716  ORF Transcript_11752/g.34716 Transcript_11752/m.34716 type:complete len:226 (+) Transcript_11752:211-888(+)